MRVVPFEKKRQKIEFDHCANVLYARQVRADGIFTLLKISFFISSIFFTEASFAQVSAFVVITPENEAEHSFQIQVETVPERKNYSRVRVIGPIDGRRQAWVIVCKEYVNASGQNFRNYLWYRGVNKNIQRVRRLHPGQTRPNGFTAQEHEYVEVDLPRDQIRRAYIYIDYPSEVDDGGYYYSIDLAFYLEADQGKKSSIRWETR